jgi:hypothetical protein
MTVGFVYGLMKSSQTFYQQPTIPDKLRQLRHGYMATVVSVVGLVVAADFGKDSWHPYVSAAVITLCASIMASSIAFPFFQIPNMAATVYFPQVRSVALSLIDGTGFFLTAPIWKIFTGILLPRYGWSVAWSVIAVLVSICGTLMMNKIPSILYLQQEQQQQQQQRQKTR